MVTGHKETDCLEDIREKFMSKYDNPMSRQVFSLPDLIETQYDDLEEKARLVLSFQEIFNIQRIVLTGCGDSYAASLAAKPIFEMLTGIPTEVVTAIDLSRYYCEKQKSPGNCGEQFRNRSQGCRGRTARQAPWLLCAGSHRK